MITTTKTKNTETGTTTVEARVNFALPTPVRLILTGVLMVLLAGPLHNWTFLVALFVGLATWKAVFMTTNIIRTRTIHPKVPFLLAEQFAIFAWFFIFYI